MMNLIVKFILINIQKEKIEIKKFSLLEIHFLSRIIMGIKIILQSKVVFYTLIDFFLEIKFKPYTNCQMEIFSKNTILNM